ncbi:DNA adenine methylase [Oceanotoga sp. DSM 15011]|uniref:DNA adenine methylase n=1 Tax=Oceanotoga sp. DSM 15011 TaxID=2984951 RepID=UPI0039A6F2F8
MFISFIYFLNKTCYNGLYRENKKGEFNVPFGRYKNPNIFEENNLRHASELLNKKDKKGNFRVKIINKNYNELIDYVNKNTFIYIDPPYRPLDKRGFNTYNKNIFNDEEQIKLSEYVNKINKLEAKFLLSNSDPKNSDKNDNFFDKLYCNYNINRIYAKRFINSKSSNRGAITELLIFNY